MTSADDSMAVLAARLSQAEQSRPETGLHDSARCRKHRHGWPDDGRPVFGPCEGCAAERAAQREREQNEARSAPPIVVDTTAKARAHSLGSSYHDPAQALARRPDEAPPSSRLEAIALDVVNARHLLGLAQHSKPKPIYQSRFGNGDGPGRVMYERPAMKAKRVRRAQAELDAALAMWEREKERAVKSGIDAAEVDRQAAAIRQRLEEEAASVEHRPFDAEDE